MKLFLRSCLCFALSTVLISSNAQDLDNPGTYMDAVSNAHAEMDKKYMAYTSAVAHGRRARKLEKMRQQVIESITNSRYKTTDLPYYKGDNTLRQACIDYIQLCYNVFTEDYNRIVNMEEIAEQSFDEMQAYILLQEKTDEKIKEATEKINKASVAFAAKNNVRIVEGDKSALGEKMEKASKLNKYTNNIYLLFFKCNWQENQMTKASNSGKLNDVEQSRNAVIRFADEGIKGLDTLKNFEGDAALAMACKNALLFYKNMAEKDAPKVTDYFLKKENFEKIKKAYEGKSNHTKEDVDAYNKAVNDFNNAVNVFNQTNNTVNKGRNEMLQNWNDTMRKFADEHMPYYKG